MLWWEKGLSYIIEGMWGGENLSEVTFMPLCEPRADAGSLAGTDKTYISSPSAASGTGQRDVPDTGLMDYRARMYSPWLGRFIQPDTIVPGAGNSQAWNRYAYGLNNPVRYIDPSGHKACVDWDNNGQCVEDPDWHGKNNPIPKDPFKNGKNGKGIRGSSRHGGTSLLQIDNEQYFDWDSMFEEENIIDILNNPNDLDVLAQLMQDTAFVLSSTGAGMEIIGFTGGLFFEGVGSVLGYSIMNGMYQILLNPIETIASISSLVLSIRSDFIRGNTSVINDGNKITVMLGEATATGFVTSILGASTSMGVWDAVIDGYGSMYSHKEICGVFNGQCH